MDNVLFSLACFIPVAFFIFVSGILIGYLIKNGYLINQNRGEASVHNLVVSNFKAPTFHLLNNVTLPFQDGTTQIDHILVSTKGIFVIETNIIGAGYLPMKILSNGRK